MVENDKKSGKRNLINFPSVILGCVMAVAINFAYRYVETLFFLTKDRYKTLEAKCKRLNFAHVVMLQPAS